MSWTAPEAIKYIKTRLGFPKRAVELDKVQFEVALDRALSQLTAYIPVFKFDTFMINAGVQGYHLPTLNKPFGKGLTRLFDSPITSPQSVFNEFEYYRLRQPPYVDMAELLIDRMYYKEIGLLTGTEFDWEWDPDSKKILLTPGPTRTRQAAYEYNADITKLDELKAVHQNWVLDYALAIAKEMLGRVRGKFQGVPGHDLPLNMDHDSLLSEAREDMRRLEEELQAKARASWTPPIKG